jgi:two-component system, chemotaxis family, sensor kinase CheA
MESAIQTYLDEAQEILRDLEQCLLDLEHAPEDGECIAKVFRCLHTVKGSGAMFGFEEIARFTHDIETVFDRVRGGDLPITQDLLTLTFQAKDHIQHLLQVPPQGTKEDTLRSDEMLREYRKYLAEPKEDRKGSAVAASLHGQPSTSGPMATFWIRFVPSESIFLSGTQPLGLLRELSELGGMHVLFHEDRIPDLDGYDPDKCYGWWDILLHTDKGADAIQDVFIFVDEEEVFVRNIGAGGIRDSDIQALLKLFRTHEKAPFDEIASGVAGLYTEQIKRRRPEEPQEADKTRTGQSQVETSSIRVDAHRLDQFVDMVGEMVTLQSRLSQAVRHLNSPVLSQLSEEMERLSDSMRDTALSIRMLPIGTVFSGLQRLIRDLSTSLGKEIEFFTEGSETELDKNVIDRLKDPLMHILRNSIDHGIEAAPVRVAAGKPPKGSIRLSACHSCGEVLITIKDDGAGIDPVRIREKALERGLITERDILNDRETIALIFEPGFSMAEKVTDLSGRGVGMDVVKRGIDELRGRVDIGSMPGQGTTLTIRLPLTLSIIEGLSVVIGKESYVVPLSTVEACQERLVADEKGECFETVERMGRLIPCISLRHILNIPGDRPRFEQVVVVSLSGNQFGMAVDEVIGRQQAVIKSLGRTFRSQSWIAGSTVNANGGISLILDVPQLLQFAKNTRVSATTGEARVNP